MKIIKRTKGLVRFSVLGKKIVLNHGENNITESDFKLLSDHPLFDSMMKTSGLKIVHTHEILKEETEETEETEERMNGSFEISNVDLHTQNKDILVDIAKGFDIETKGLNKAEIIEAIESLQR